MSNQAFTEFEHRGWQRVADKYDSTWASSTRQFIAPLLDAVEVSDKMSILDVGCGPGYVSAGRAGFDGTSMKFKLYTIEWQVPTPDFVFEAERNAGVRTAGLLARQTPEALNAIKARIENAVRFYAKANGFAIPKSAYIVAVTKS
jgi:protein-L-isoaspartate O-methyltransferase